VRVVVTGGAGFIGANLCATLAADDGTDVVAFDDLSTGFASNLVGVRASLVEGDILDPHALDLAFAGAHAVVHLAARPSVPRSITDPLASHQANATGTVQVLEAVRRSEVPYVVVASSSSVYGANPTLPKSEDLVPAPLSPYAVSKLATEAYTNAYAHSYGLDTLAFRFFNVYGPLQAAGHAYAAVVPAFIEAALAGRALPINGDGSQTRDFTYVGTVAAVIRDAIARRVTSPTPVNLAFGGRSSLLELVAMLEEQLGTRLERDHRDPRVGDVPHSQADQTLLRELFPDVEPVGLTAGIERTIAWFRSS
jgi:UDP-glucose 4-epimerase